MPIELKIPSAGESITEVMIGEWLVAEGDFVEEDEPVVIIETDKVNMEVPAPKSGKITKILKAEGEDAEVGDVVGHMEEGEADGSADEKDADDADGEEEADAKSEKASEKTSGKETKKSADGKQDAQDDDAPDDDTEGDESEGDGDARVMPAARRLLAEHGLEASDVKATGPGGRLLKEDVQRHVEKSGDEGADKTSKARSDDGAEGERTSSGPRDTERVKMTPLRRKVASRLVQAQEEAALLTTFNEVDMSAVMELRDKYKQPFQERYDIKLGFMSFFVKAAVEALKEIPQVNAEIDGDEIVYHNYQDIGVAVGGGKGLVVPILRNAERMSFADVEKKIADLASRAQKGKLELDELQGGTFTISNGGVYGSLLSTPIVNPPQSGILGLHKIEERPIALNGDVVIRPMMYLALTYDHRIVDGREAVTFLIKIKERIEDPARILLEV